MLEEKQTKGDPFRRMHGADLGLSWIEEDEMAMREPIVIEKPDGLGMKMPSNDLTVNDIAELVGEDAPVEVIGAFNLAYSPIRPHILVRCCHPVNFTWMDSTKVGRIYGTRAGEARQNPKRHIAGNILN